MLCWGDTGKQVFDKQPNHEALYNMTVDYTTACNEISKLTGAEFVSQDSR
jgi:hypothetical protein